MPIVEEVCTITARGQTTVPKIVRQALGVGYGGRIAFRVEGDVVTIHGLPEQDEHDPALAPFLALLEADMASRPAAAVRPMSETFVNRLEKLTADIPERDLDEPIIGEVSL